MFIKTTVSFLHIVFCAALALWFCGCSERPKQDLGVPQQRAKVVDAYLAEFSDPSFMASQIGPAIRDVMMRLPQEALKTVMDRRRPVLFVDVYSSGTGRFASSSEVIVTEKDVPAFQRGMTLIKINDAIAEGPSEAVRGIVAHEIAHRVLDHVRRGHVSCQSER